MKIEIKDNEFTDLAKELKTTPENVVKIFLDHAKHLHHKVLLDAIQEGSSLDAAMEKLMKNAEVAFNVGELIGEIIGYRDYLIDDSGYNMEKGTVWFHVSFLEGEKGHIDSILLQFGSDPGIVATASIKKIKLDKDMNEIETEIYDAIDYSGDDYDQLNFSWDWIDENFLTWELQIDTPGEFLNLPKVDEVETIMKKIQEIILSHKTK